MAKAKARRRVRDTWKEKSWYTIKTPVNFEDKEIGETPARDPDYLIGRGVEVTMRELSGDFSKQYIKLRFEIDNVAGDVANTKFTGHKTTTDYVRSMIRRGTSRIDASSVSVSFFSMISGSTDGMSVRAIALESCEGASSASFSRILSNSSVSSTSCFIYKTPLKK